MQLDSQLVFNWNQVFWGATTLLAKLTNAGAYHQLVCLLPPRHGTRCPVRSNSSPRMLIEQVCRQLCVLLPVR